MISNMQKQMLQRAAQREQGSMGSISMIFAIAMQMQDWDTCDYIAQHYASAQHFTSQQLEIVEGYKIAAAQDGAAEAVQH